MVDSVKEFRQIDIHRNPATFLDDVVYLFYRLLPIAIRTKPEAVVRESRIKNRREHLGNGLLDHAITDGWYPGRLEAPTFGTLSHPLR